jgi:hypothetical protein
MIKLEPKEIEMKTETKPVHLAVVGTEAITEQVGQVFQAAQPAMIASLVEKGVLKVEFLYIFEDKNKTVALRHEFIVRLFAVGISAFIVLVALLRFS